MLHAWHLVLGLSVLLLWCMVGWWRSPKELAPGAPTPAAPPAPPRTSFVDDLRSSIAGEPVDDVVERWRGRVPPR